MENAIDNSTILFLSLGLYTHSIKLMLLLSLLSMSLLYCANDLFRSKSYLVPCLSSLASLVSFLFWFAVWLFCFAIIDIVCYGLSFQLLPRFASYGLKTSSQEQDDAVF